LIARLLAAEPRRLGGIGKYSRRRRKLKERLNWKLNTLQRSSLGKDRKAEEKANGKADASNPYGRQPRE
jgi:hypothetical protein